MDITRLSAFIPTAMLDAGDTEWADLSKTVTERLDTLPAYGVLEISFGNPSVRIPLLEWCRSVGHDRFQMVADGDQTSLWIKKG